jgi:hypothetical protein
VCEHLNETSCYSLEFHIMIVTIFFLWVSQVVFPSHVGDKCVNESIFRLVQKLFP